MHGKVGFPHCEVTPDFSLRLLGQVGWRGECRGSSLSKGWGSQKGSGDPAGGNSRMSWGRQSLWERGQRLYVLCSPPPPSKGSFPSTKAAL